MKHHSHLHRTLALPQNETSAGTGSPGATLLLFLIQTFRLCIAHSLFNLVLITLAASRRCRLATGFENQSLLLFFRHRLTHGFLQLGGWKSFSLSFWVTFILLRDKELDQLDQMLCLTQDEYNQMATIHEVQFQKLSLLPVVGKDILQLYWALD